MAGSRLFRQILSRLVISPDSTPRGIQLLQAVAGALEERGSASARERQVPAGILIEAGSTPPLVYVLTAGEADILRPESDDDLIARVSAPALLGEMAHIAGGATATVRVRPPGARLIELSREEFIAAVEADPGTWQRYQDLVTGRLLEQAAPDRPVAPRLARALLRVAMPIHEDRTEDALLEKMAEGVLRERPDLMRWRRYGPGQDIIIEDQPIDTVFVLVRGSAGVRKAGREIVQVGPGTLLGEISALSGLVPTATVTAAADGAEVLYLSRADFQQHVLADAQARADARSLVLARLREQYSAMPLEPGPEERLRTVRDQNTDALIRRQGIRVIAGDGVYRLLNPTATAFVLGGARSLGVVPA